CRIKAWRARPLLSRQIGIARGEREAVCFAHRLRRKNLRLKVEIARHLRHDLELLKILFAKDREIGTALVEKFCNYDSYARKMGWAEAILEANGRRASQRDRGGKAFAIYLLHARREQKIAVRRCE